MGDFVALTLGFYLCILLGIFLLLFVGNLPLYYTGIFLCLTYGDRTGLLYQVHVKLFQLVLSFFRVQEFCIQFTNGKEGK